MAPLEQTSDCSLLIYRPRKDERLSWPSWLTCRGRVTIYPYNWSLVSCRSSAGQWKFAGQRPTFYRCVTPPTSDVTYGRLFQRWLPATETITWQWNVCGKTEIPWERVPYLSTLEVLSRQGAIQIHVYLTLPYLNDGRNLRDTCLELN